MVSKYLILAVALILLIPIAGASKGAGIKWGVSSAIIDEGESKCIDYGIYNPWDEDVSISLTVGGDISQFADEVELLPKFVKAGTLNTESIFQSLCFTPKNVRGCSPGQTIRFKGEIIAMPVIDQQATGSGSLTATSASAPLELAVRCGEGISVTSYSFFIGLLILLIIIVAVVWYLYKKRNEKELKL